MSLQITLPELEANVKAIREGLIAPYISVQGSTLGGVHRSSIMICVSLDGQKDWTNSILENSRYARFSVHSDMKLTCFSSSYKIKNKFRKCTIKSVQDVIERINKYITENEAI